MVAIPRTGPHYSDPWLMTPASIVAASISDGTNSAATVAFFTAMTGEGVIDTTDWTSNTYKTIYSHTGKGLIAGCIGCTAGGAETTTFEITIDGVLSELTVTNANTERAFLSAPGFITNNDFVTAAVLTGVVSALDVSTKTTLQTGSYQMPPLRVLGFMGAALLRYNVSALVRMKHSVNITNSTATAYSAVLVRKGIAA